MAGVVVDSGQLALFTIIIGTNLSHAVCERLLVAAAIAATKARHGNVIKQQGYRTFRSVHTMKQSQARWASLVLKVDVFFFKMLSSSSLLLLLLH